MKNPLSVFVIARNEEARIGRTLAALDWADQIVVVDSGSTDATREIARAAGAEVHEHVWEGYGQQKAFAESLCRHDWLLNVDADEIVTPALAVEIAQLIAAGPPPGAYRVRILNVYPGRDRPRWLADDYNVVRFYHRAVGRYRVHELFERVETDVAPGQLRGPLHHFPLLSWAHFVDKENRYSSYAAEIGRPRSRPALLLRLPFEMPLAFLRFYVLRRHFTGGWQGYVFALSAAFARTLRIAKMLERNRSARAAPAPEAPEGMHDRPPPMTVAVAVAVAKDDDLAKPAVDRSGGQA
jgi:glycosyltransferase involved in cell wall biosynthesis